MAIAYFLDFFFFHCRVCVQTSLKCVDTTVSSRQSSIRLFCLSYGNWSKPAVSCCTKRWCCMHTPPCCHDCKWSHTCITFWKVSRSNKTFKTFLCKKAVHYMICVLCLFSDCSGSQSQPCSLQPLKEAISVLFSFTRRVLDDAQFQTDVHLWLERLVLSQAHLFHLYIYNYIRLDTSYWFLMCTYSVVL